MKLQVRQAIAIDLHTCWHDGQSQNRAPHRNHRCLKDVDGIYLCGVGPGDRPGQRVVFDFISQHFATTGAELLGIIETGDWAIGIQYHGCSDDWAGQGPAPGLVDTGDEP
jgi:hypothetical protein